MSAPVEIVCTDGIQEARVSTFSEAFDAFGLCEYGIEGVAMVARRRGMKLEDCSWFVRPLAS